MNIDRIINLIKESRKSRKCPPGSRWTKKKRTCVPKKSSRWRTVYAGWGRGRNENEDDDGKKNGSNGNGNSNCLLYTSPSPRDRTRSRMPSSA